MSIRLLTILAAFALVAAVFGSYTAGVVFASHYLYIGMDPDLQRPPAETGGNTLPENYVNAKWALHDRSTAVTWEARPPIRDHFARALANWTAAVPELKWREVSSSADYDVLVYQDALCRGLAGLFRVNDWAPSHPDVPGGWHTDSKRSANYWKKANICLKSNFSSPTTEDYPSSITAHEIGHAYGLYEAYIDNPPVANPCNNSVTSLMDAGYRKLFLSGYKWTHCDGLTGPSEWDVARVRDFFGPVHGGPVDFAGEVSGSQCTFRWRDDAWGEVRHELRYLYRLDSENENQIWVQYEKSDVVAYTGRHKQIGGQVSLSIRFRDDITLTAHTRGRAFETLSAKSAYQVCGRAFFTQYNLYSGLRCSPVVKVSNAFHNEMVPIANHYDANDNKIIEKSDLIEAINDYLFDAEATITKAQVIALTNLYLSG